MKDFLAIIGGAALWVIGFFLIVGLWCGLKELIHTIRYNYRIKHRFDKPPTAKCYCIDCVRHNNETQRCYKFDGWYTADCWFCWDADPRKKEDIHEKN